MTVKLFVYGFLAWLIPFIASIFFYTPQGELTIDIFLFKTIMILVGSLTSALLLVSYFRTVRENFIQQSVVLGVTWFVMNILLDLVVLIPMSGMSVSDYFTQIGLRYLVMPITSITLGFALRNNASQT